MLRDVAVGKDAVYISRDSRDPDTPHIHTKFLEAQINKSVKARTK